MSQKEKTPRPEDSPQPAATAGPETAAPSAGDPAPPRAAAARPREQASRRLQEAQRAYNEALQSVQEESQRAASQACRDYLHRLQDAYAEGQRRSLEAHRSYLKAYSEAAEAENAAETLLTEQLRYGRDLEEAANGLARQVADAGKDYCRRAEQERERLQGTLEAAYRSYLRALRDAWAGLDVDAIDPQLAASLGCGLLAAAQTGWSSGVGRS